MVMIHIIDGIHWWYIISTNNQPVMYGKYTNGYMDLMYGKLAIYWKCNPRHVFKLGGDDGILEQQVLNARKLTAGSSQLPVCEGKSSYFTGCYILQHDGSAIRHLSSKSFLKMSYQRDPVSPSRMLHSWSHSANLESRNTQRTPMFFPSTSHSIPRLTFEWYGSRVWEEITLGIGSPWNLTIFRSGCFVCFLISFWWWNRWRQVLFFRSPVYVLVDTEARKPWCFFACKFWDPSCSNRCHNSDLWEGLFATPKFNSKKKLKNDSWNTTFLWGRSIFQILC